MRDTLISKDTAILAKEAGFNLATQHYFQPHATTPNNSFKHARNI